NQPFIRSSTSRCSHRSNCRTSVACPAAAASRPPYRSPVTTTYTPKTSSPTVSSRHNAGRRTTHPWPAPGAATTDLVPAAADPLAAPLHPPPLGPRSPRPAAPHRAIPPNALDHTVVCAIEVGRLLGELCVGRPGPGLWGRPGRVVPGSAGCPGADTPE